MPLKYYVTPNPMNSSDDFMAVSKRPESYSLEDVFEHMTREGSTITKAEALAGFEEVSRGIINLLKQGNSVVTPLVNLSPSITGVFEGEDDRFDPDRHQVKINVTPGKRLRETAPTIPTQKIMPRERSPEPAHYYDYNSETQDQVITPQGAARITGSLLKFDEQDQDQGVFFVNTSDGTETRVNIKMIKNKPGELIISNPRLEAGHYRLEVRSLLDGTKDIRKGALPDELTVPGD
ncbi:DUF4469 domain-containing protein [Aliifodinibius sp. S!AR15-10]|uniref:DNA-binding domain-containing protein n=1 Tax=Aliifodinibius sp. S!AR15-10 TaxID=2950437 RepID=UPI002862CCAD|nr:DNA-binding domain-containing protein [Aliifodinibius sp. S!AR15-10]MDR8392863.1 DUF4469 domain-containing protein [Aliifodinibius sp. S!AR15-10]